MRKGRFGSIFILFAVVGSTCVLGPGVTGAATLAHPVVGVVATPEGKGYWEVASDGGVFALGDATFEGSMGGQVLGAPVVGMSGTPDGNGYREVASDGGIFAFGDAAFEGSMGGQHLNAPVVGMAATPDGLGYWEVASDGGSFPFGDAVPVGSPPSVAPRVAFYGDSLGMESAQNFISDVQAAGGSAFVRTYVSAVCDWLPEMPGDIASFQPTAVVLEFAGDNFTQCMAGYSLGSPQYYAKYQADMQSAINLLRAYGADVYLVGIPYDNNTSLNPIVANLNQIYASLAAANTGVDYVDAGQAVMLNGTFTWTLPCLPSEPCTGPPGTNVVRGPDGSHFCPSGSDTIVGYFAECTVYSSGAFRFAAAMLKPVLAGG